jgi:hypothetical protein
MATRLTKLEATILQHRLEVPDAVIDSLTDDIDDDSQLEKMMHSVASSVDLLFESIQSTKAIPDSLSDVDKLVLRNCIEASTYFVAAEADMTEQASGRLFATCCRLAEKVSAVIGHSVSYSPY